LTLPEQGRTLTVKRTLETTYEPIVREALKSKAPGLYADLSRSGELEAFVKERALEIKEGMHLARTRLIAQRKVSFLTDYMEKVQMLTEIDRTAREVVLRELLEFPQ
jgi:hypothetical protein